MTPIFLLSLPRSGSTLLQRMLAQHEDIVTTAEPWILLPLFYMFKRDKSAADYDHTVLVDAVEDFAETLPAGKRDFDAAINQFATALYTKQGDGRYFLDKTPRYSLIAPEIPRVFPEAKYIFLWRNPLAVMASMIETWGQGRWVLFRYYADLFEGQKNLVLTQRRLGDGCLNITYESLVRQPEIEITRALEFLTLPQGALPQVHLAQTPIKGRLGDVTGAKKYNHLSTDSIDLWEKSVRNPLRRFWFKKYLMQIGAADLALMGYDLDALLAALYRAPISHSHLFSDAIVMIYGLFFRSLNLPQLRRRFRGSRPVVVQK